MIFPFSQTSGTKSSFKGLLRLPLTILRVIPLTVIGSAFQKPRTQAFPFTSKRKSLRDFLLTIYSIPTRGEDMAVNELELCPTLALEELVGAPLQSDCTPFRTGAEIILTGCPESRFLNTLSPDRRASFLLRVQTSGTKQLVFATQTIPFEKIVRG